MNLRSYQQPVAGGIYHDNSDNSLVVLNIIGGKVLPEYAIDTVTSIDAKNWQPLEPHVAVY
jgi:hypothetical protein